MGRWILTSFNSSLFKKRSGKCDECAEPAIMWIESENGYLSFCGDRDCVVKFIETFQQSLIIAYADDKKAKSV